jgi:hypothetical protein
MLKKSLPYQVALWEFNHQQNCKEATPIHNKIKTKTKQNV